MCLGGPIESSPPAFWIDEERKEQITMSTDTQQVGSPRQVQVPGFIARLGYFIWHFLGAGKVGYPDMLERFPEFSLLAIGTNLAIPMTAWMRFRRHEWRETLEMSSTSILLAILLIGLAWLGIISMNSRLVLLKELACPVMLSPMLFRLHLYTGHHAGHGPAPVTHPATDHSGHTG
jgi:hypothetical protein